MRNKNLIITDLLTVFDEYESLKADYDNLKAKYEEAIQKPSIKNNIVENIGDGAISALYKKLKKQYFDRQIYEYSLPKVQEKSNDGREHLITFEEWIDEIETSDFCSSTFEDLSLSQAKLFFIEELKEIYDVKIAELQGTQDTEQRE